MPCTVAFAACSSYEAETAEFLPVHMAYKGDDSNPYGIGNLLFDNIKIKRTSFFNVLYSSQNARSESPDAFQAESDFSSCAVNTDNDCVGSILLTSVWSEYMGDGGCLTVVQLAG